jgi:hypothetical protein
MGKRIAVAALALAVASLGAFGLAAGAKKKAATPVPAPDPLDQPEVFEVGAARAKLAVFHDGKGHYVAMNPDVRDDETEDAIFYGDGKTFWQLRRIGGGASDERFDVTFWDPRIGPGWKRSLGGRGGKLEVQCDDRVTPLASLARPEADALLAAATFYKPRWKRMAYLLARDESGTYYFVDRMRQPEDNKFFRLFVGKKGNLKLTKLVNVVSDSQGDIFSSKTGELRLIASDSPEGSRELVWVKGKKRTKLVNVPVQDNGALIYSELGVYAGQPLGTPCDDL